MKLDKENTKQIIKIVTVAIILLAVVLNIGTVWNGIKVFLNIISPFIWGLAIAFILNIFMTFYENIVFQSPFLALYIGSLPLFLLNIRLFLDVFSLYLITLLSIAYH